MQVRKQQLKADMGTTDCFQIGKEVLQGCILTPCLFNFDAECIKQNAGMDEVQAGIKIAGRNINNLRYADDTTLTADSQEELKSLLMKVREESASSPITSWQRDGETMATVADFIFLGSKITVDYDCNHKNKRHLAPWKKSYHQPRQHIKKQRRHFADKIRLVTAIILAVVMYGYENWPITKAKH